MQMSLSSNGTRRALPHPQDGRAQCVHLTEKARALEAPATAAARAVNERALAGLPPADREAFLGTMRQVVGALQADLKGEGSGPSGRKP